MRFISGCSSNSDACFSAAVPHLPPLCSRVPPREAAELLEPCAPPLGGRASPQQAPGTQQAPNVGVGAQLRVDPRQDLVPACACVHRPVRLSCACLCAPGPAGCVPAPTSASPSSPSWLGTGTRSPAPCPFARHRGLAPGRLAELSPSCGDGRTRWEASAHFPLTPTFHPCVPPHHPHE